jgi:bacterioferritin
MTTKEELIKGLNEDLAAELGTVIRYTYQSSKATGFVGAELREILEDEIADELGHAAYLMDIIVDLGGEPTTTPRPFDKPEGLKAMLELDMNMEKQDVEEYKTHAAMAEELGLVDVQMKLEEMAADEAGHARELRRLVKGM